MSSEDEVLSRYDIPLRIALPLDDWLSVEFRYDRRRGLLVGFQPENAERKAQGKRKLWRKPDAVQMELVVAGLNEIAGRSRAWYKRMMRKFKREIRNRRPLVGGTKIGERGRNASVET